MDVRNACVALLVGLATVGGCVRPGRIDVTRLGRYRQAMAARAPRQLPEDPADLPDASRPGLIVPVLSSEPVVERLTETTRTYTPPAGGEGGGQQDRIREVRVVTDFPLDGDTGRPRPGAGRVARREEVETTRHFRLVKDPSRPIRPVVRRLVRSIRREVEFSGGASGRLTRRRETVTTTEYFPPAPPATAPATAPADGEEPQVRVVTVVRARRYAADGRGGAEPVEQPEVRRESALPLWQYEELGGRPWPAAANTLKTSRRARVGQASGAPAVLGESRRLVRVSLPQVLRAALAANPDIRVVSFEPEVSREEMTAAAAAFDTAVYFQMDFLKEEGGNPALALAEDVRRIRSWEAGLRGRSVTGATWTLRNALSRNWDSSTMDGLYKSVAALEVTQPLLRNAWPAFNLATLRVARVNREVSSAAFRQKVEEVVSTTAAAYWRLVDARRQVGIQRELIDLAREVLIRTRARLSVDATRASVEQARASLKRRQSDLVELLRRVGDAQDELAHLAPVGALRRLGRAELLPTTDPLTEPLGLDATEQLLAALRHSPLLEQARLAVAAAKINVTVAENQVLPAVDLTASVQVQRFNPSVSGHWDVTATPGEHALGYELGLLVDYPIGNRLAMARLRQARLAQTQSIATMQKTVNDLSLAVSRQVRAVQRAREKVVALREAVAAARAELLAVRQGEQAETRISPQVLRTRLRAQEGVARAARDLEDAIAEYNIAWAELNRITGTALEVNGVRLGPIPTRP